MENLCLVVFTLFDVFSLPDEEECFHNNFGDLNSVRLMQ